MEQVIVLGLVVCLLMILMPRVAETLIDITRGIWGISLCLVAAIFWRWDKGFNYFLGKAELTNFGNWW